MAFNLLKNILFTLLLNLLNFKKLTDLSNIDFDNINFNIKL